MGGVNSSFRRAPGAPGGSASVPDRSQWRETPPTVNVKSAPTQPVKFQNFPTGQFSHSHERILDVSIMPRRKKEEEEAMSPRDRAPRGAANARERTRMRVLSKAFGRLKLTLPWVPPDTKLSKLDTLRYVGASTNYTLPESNCLIALIVPRSGLPRPTSLT